MPGFLVQLGATVMCSHGAPVTLVPTDSMVLAGGLPVGVLADTFVIAGCPNSVPPAKPCTQLMWAAPATRVFVGGKPAILAQAPSLTDGTPPSPGTVVVTQARVRGM